MQRGNGGAARIVIAVGAGSLRPAAIGSPRIAAGTLTVRCLSPIRTSARAQSSWYRTGQASDGQTRGPARRLPTEAIEHD
jgi:hypothetical protein